MEHLQEEGIIWCELYFSAYRVPIGCVVLGMFRNLPALLSRFPLKNPQYQNEKLKSTQYLGT